MMRGRAFRYLRWQVIDRAGPRLLASLFLVTATCWLVHKATANGPPPDDQVARILLQVHQQLSFLIVMLFVHGIVSIDRVQGFYRFYLAKPVSPIWFYGQAIVLAFLGTVAASAGFVAIASWMVKPVWPWEAVPHAIAMFAIVGMLMFFYGMLSRHDWLWAIATVLLASVLRNQWPAKDGMPGRVLEAVLPPNHLIGSAEHPTATQWLWIAGWAVGLFALGLVLLRARPLGED